MRLRAPLRRMAGDRRDLVVGGATVGELLRELERLEPALSGWILDERGTVRRHIKVFVNGEDTGAEAPVGPDDLIDVLPAISGG